MTYLNGLTFVAAPQGKGEGPRYHRRSKLAARLEEQARLLVDPAFAPTDKRWVKGNDGTKNLVDVVRRVKPWWQRSVEGKYVLSVRHGHHRMEFEAGKSGIELPSIDAVGETITKLISATLAGELDPMIEKAAENSRPRAVSGQKPQSSKPTKKTA